MEAKKAKSFVNWDINRFESNRVVMKVQAAIKMAEEELKEQALQSFCKACIEYSKMVCPSDRCEFYKTFKKKLDENE